MVAQTKVNSPVIFDSATLSLYEKISLVLAGSVLLVISAKIMVPFWPVPMTLQPLAAIMLGIMLGPRLGAAAALTYLMQGAAGLPVFASLESFPGLAILARPSAGFLLSFPMAAFVAGYLVQQGWTKTWTKTIGIFLAAYAIIYAIGLSWFAGLVGTELAFQNMMLWMPSDVAKIGLGVTATQVITAYKQRS